MLARLRDILPIGQKTVVSLEIDRQAASLEKYSGKELQVEIRQYRPHRSLRQNAYYWSIITDVAEKVGCTTAYMHNDILRRHPRPFIIGGKVAHVPIPDTEEAWDEAMESETFHVKPSSQVIEGNDGVMYRTYTILRGSSDYDTSEMTVLLNDLIDEAKRQGIDTATPAELERMRQYDEQQAERQKRREGMRKSA